MQALAMVCKENNSELERKQCLLKYFCGKRYEFEGSHRKSGGTYQNDFLKDDSS